MHSPPTSARKAYAGVCGHAQIGGAHGANGGAPASCRWRVLALCCMPVGFQRCRVPCRERGDSLRTPAHRHGACPAQAAAEGAAAADAALAAARAAAAAAERRAEARGAEAADAAGAAEEALRASEALAAELDDARRREEALQVPGGWGRCWGRVG
jgi:hypothetical protein